MKKLTKLLALLLGVFLFILTGDFIGSTSISSSETDNQEINNETFLTEGYLRLISQDYFYLTDTDLGTYHPNLVGKKVYIVAEVSSVKDAYITCNVFNEFFDTLFYTEVSYVDYKDLLVGQQVIIVGEVKELKNIGLGFSRVQLDGCYVSMVGNNTSEYEADKSDIRLAQYLTSSSEVVEQSKLYDINTQDYIDFADKQDWNSILKKPYEYTGKMVKIVGTVDSVSDGFMHTTTFFIKDEDKNMWYCTYVYDKGDYIIQKGKSITVYGEILGVSSSSSDVILGNPEVPNIDVKAYAIGK